MLDQTVADSLYLFEERDRLKIMKAPKGKYYTQQYDAASRRTALLLGLGCKRRYEYASLGRLARQVKYNAWNQAPHTMTDAHDAVETWIGRATNGAPPMRLYAGSLAVPAPTMPRVGSPEPFWTGVEERYWHDGVGIGPRRFTLEQLYASY